MSRLLILLVLVGTQYGLLGQSGDCSNSAEKAIDLPTGPASPFRTDLDQYVDSDSEHARTEVRRHGWELFRSITSNIPGGCETPYWLTWRTKEEIQKPEKGFQILDLKPRRVSISVSPTLRGGREESIITVKKEEKACNGKKTSCQLTPNRLFSSSHFNPELVRDLHAAGLWEPRRLKNLCNAAPGTTACRVSVDRVSQTPLGRTSVIVKPIWVPIRAQDSLCLPVWNPNKRPNDLGPWPFESWGSYVAVSPSEAVQKDDAKSGRTCEPNTSLAGEGLPGVKRAGFLKDDFYWLPITSRNRGSFKSFRPKLILPVRPYFAEKGDVVILVGLHIITKEVDSWTWNTYWWAPEEYRKSKGYGHDRPSLPGPWSNYVMDASLNRAGAPEGDTPTNGVFNPYQESVLSNRDSGFMYPKLGGLASNCRSCHERAAYPVVDPPPLVTVPGMDPTDMKNRIQTNFLWSIANYHETADTRQAKGKR